MDACGSTTGPVLQFAWLDFINNKFTLINQVTLAPADLADQQLELELVHGTAGNDAISARYAFGNGNTLGTFSGTLTTLGTTTASTDVFTPSLQFVQTGFEAFAPAPEPSTLLLLGVGGLALGALGRRCLHRRT